jgi:hypothetical protein
MKRKQRGRQMKEYHNGYPLFNGDEDEFRRTRNRGFILLNIVEDMTAKGAGKDETWKEVASYLSNIPEREHHLIMLAAEVAAAHRHKGPWH